MHYKFINLYLSIHYFMRKLHKSSDIKVIKGKISDFKKVYDNSFSNHILIGYQIIASDWQNEYMSDVLKWSECYGCKELDSSIFEDLWIKFDANNKERMDKDLEKLFENLNISWSSDNYIEESIYNAHILLQDFHLDDHGKEYYYNEDIDIHVDTSNTKNYYIDLNSAWKIVHRNMYNTPWYLSAEDIEKIEINKSARRTVINFFLIWPFVFLFIFFIIFLIMRQFWQ